MSDNINKFTEMLKPQIKVPSKRAEYIEEVKKYIEENYTADNEQRISITMVIRNIS